MSALPVVVTYEDRASAVPGVELLARSLQRHSPGLALQVHSPLEEVAQRLADLPATQWVPTHDLAGRGWNAKPIILNRGLEAHERVLWLDTDVVLRSDIRPHLARFAPDDLVVGQEFRFMGPSASELRARGFGLKVARAIPHAVNSGSILASRAHRPLFARWLELLESPAYREAQALHVRDRPVAFVGDQDALWALLVSDEFADVSLDYFRLGRDMILHCGANGYHVVDRLGHLVKNETAFVHMLGRYKPWSFVKTPDWRREKSDYLHQLCFELSPFFTAAQADAGRLGNPPWLRRRTLPGRVLNALGLGNPALSGLPLALGAWLLSAAFDRRPEL